MAKELRKTKDHPDVTAMLQEQREERATANEQAMERMDSCQPTPTQEENDLARLGIQVDEKEPDGSGPTVIHKTLVANVPLGYDTKSVIAKEQEKPTAFSSSRPRSEVGQPARPRSEPPNT